MDEPTTTERVRRGGHRLRSCVLCRLGRHLYVRRRNPDVSGSAATYWECRRCGHEEKEYQPGGNTSFLG